MSILLRTSTKQHKAESGSHIAQCRGQRMFGRSVGVTVLCIATHPLMHGMVTVTIENPLLEYVHMRLG